MIIHRLYTQKLWSLERLQYAAVKLPSCCHADDTVACTLSRHIVYTRVHRDDSNNAGHVKRRFGLTTARTHACYSDVTEERLFRGLLFASVQLASCSLAVSWRTVCLRAVQNACVSIIPQRTPKSVAIDRCTINKSRGPRRHAAIDTPQRTTNEAKYCLNDRRQAD